MNRPPMLDRTPFVIILDDLQWADAVTLVTQRFLVRARRHLEYGRLADAAGEAETAQRIAGELGLARPASAALGILGQVAFHQGDLAAAEACARAAELAADWRLRATASERTVAGAS